MRDLMRPSRHHKKRKKSFIKKLFRALIWGATLVCFMSAAPMVYLRFIDPSTSMYIELNKRSNNPNILHEWRDMEDISLYFPNAVIASEDQQFPNHFGFDIKQIKLVLDEKDKGRGYSRGASTITQQTVKNMFLWPQRSFVRKGVEAWLALWMEMIVPKKRILEIYLNYAQFGKRVFGVGAASQHYFGVEASQLTPEQSALIAAALPTPSRSNPANPSPYLRERADYILDQMPRVGGRRMVRELDD